MPVALAFAVIELGAGPGGLGVVLAARVVPSVAFTLAGGVLGDRMSRTRLMAAADATRFATQGLAAALLLAGTATVGALAAVQVVHGAASAMFDPAAGSAVPATVSDKRLLQPANALLGMSRSFASIIGPILAGLLVALTSPGWAIAADAATFGVSAAFLLSIRIAAPRVSHEPSGFFEDLRDGWRGVASRMWLWASLLEGAVFHLSFLAMLFVLGPFVAEDAYDGATSWAYVLSAFGLGCLAGGAAALRFPVARPLLAGNVALAMCATSLLALAMAAPLWLVVVAQLPAGFGIMFYDTLWMTTLQSVVPSDLLSRIHSYDVVVSTALWPLGLVIAGPISSVLGLQAALLGAAAVMLAAVVGTLLVAEIRTFHISSERTHRD